MGFRDVLTSADPSVWHRLHIPVLLWLVLAASTTRAASDAPAGAPTSSSFDSAGVKIAYLEAGRGEPVILIHGMYSSAQMNWVVPGTFKQLSANYHVIAPDLRGHGQSDKPTDDASYGQPMVEDVVRLMDHLKIEKAHVIGYSMGGIVAMKLMVDHPDRVLSTALGGMGWLREGSRLQESFEQLSGRRGARTPPACVHGLAKLAVTEEQLKKIKAPVEMLIGDRDPCRRLYVDPAAGVRTDWPVIEIKDAGHITCVAKPQFQDALKAWLDRSTTR
jgi:pimeloyl-ACP methyl ester carboxylesterase